MSRFSHDFFQQLANHVITNNYCNTVEDLIESYHHLIGFLKPIEWEKLSDIVCDISPIFQKRDNIYEEFLSKLRIVPTYDVVEQKLGSEFAETFLKCQEETNLPIEITDQKFTKQQLLEILQLLAIATCNNKGEIITNYEQYKTRKLRESQEKRERVRDSNMSLIQKVQDVNIWFPYSKDKEQWLSDPRTKDYAFHFFVLITQVKKLMKQHRCLLQYITKKRFTVKSIGDLERNMEAMGAYLYTK